jgi:RNA polymerase sigma-70 factor (ECF subfamily)
LVLWTRRSSGSRAQDAGIEPVRAEPQPDRLKDLAQRAVQGDRSARSQLVREVGPAMLRVIRAVLGSDHPEVEDVLQDSLVAFVRALEVFRGECSVAHYACRIALQRGLDARKHWRVVKRALGRLEQDGNQDVQLPPDGAVTDQRRSELLRQLLCEIPAEQSEALILRHALGFSIDEIAAAVSAPRNTIRSRLRLAKEALRGRIADNGVWRELEEKSG